PADGSHDLVYDPQKVAFVLEANRRDLDFAATLDAHLLVSIDDDVGDRMVLEQRFQRAKSKQLVEDVGDELLALAFVEQAGFAREHIADEVADLGLELLARHLLDDGKIDLVDQPL